MRTVCSGVRRVVSSDVGGSSGRVRLIRLWSVGRSACFAIACGYPDANDADSLADDPIQKLLLERDPIGGTRLASQPTISRFENALGPRALYRLGETLAETVIADGMLVAECPRRHVLWARSGQR